MENLIISGSIHPEIGKEEFYSIFPTGTDTTINSLISSTSSEQIRWEVYILENGIWQKSDEKAKFGNTAAYNFRECCIAKEGLKIVVTRGNDKGELIIKPQKAIHSKKFLDVNYTIPKGANYKYVEKKQERNTSASPEQMTAKDSKEKILSVNFLNLEQQPLMNIQIGISFYAQIQSNAMKGKIVRLKIWKGENIFNNLVYEENITLTNDVCLVKLILDEKMHENVRDNLGQEYFLEIEYTTQSVNSSAINLNDNAPNLN